MLLILPKIIVSLIETRASRSCKSIDTSLGFYVTYRYKDVHYFIVEVNFLKSDFLSKKKESKKEK